MKKLLLLLAGILALQYAAAQNRQSIHPDSSQIRLSGELIGLAFDSTEIAQMSRNLAQQQRNLESIRAFSLDNSTRPALIFDPFPPDQVITPPEVHPTWIVPFGIQKPDHDADLAFMSIPELASLIKYRRISSEALTCFFIDRLKQSDSVLHCVTHLTEEHAMEQARKADQELNQGIYRGILHGIPFGVKDLLAYPGYPTTWGAEPYRDQVIDREATVIQKLEAAGAVMVAKLTLGALAMGDVWYGGTTRNPWNTEQGSSGSSAGPAAAVSAGLLPFAIGSETLGSIVSPSTRCSVTGLRPGFGRVSKTGAMALSWSMDKLGPICRSAQDCAIVFDALVGGDPADPSVLDSGFDYPVIQDFKNLRVGYVADYFSEESKPSPNDLKVLEVFRTLGANLQEVQLPDSFPVNALRLILTAEAAAAFDELTLSDRDNLLVSQHDWAWPNTFRSARFIPAVEYINANRIRSLLVAEMNEIFTNYDVVIVPSFAGNQLTLTNLSGHPAVLLPTGFDEKKNPTSVTLIGAHFSEGVLLAAGALFQQSTELHLRRPPKFDR